jgi:nucleoside-diphosphate-sugar epimerase
VVAAAGQDPDAWEIRHGEAQAGDIRRSAADIEALRTATGWEPVTGLDEGLRRTAAWAAAS